MTAHHYVTLFTWAGTVGLAYLWIFHSGQTQVDRSARRVRSVAIRTAFVFSVLHLALSGRGIGVYSLLMISFAVIFFVIPTILPKSARDLLLMPDAAAVAFWIVFVVQQFVLGWPVRNELIPTTSLASPDPLQNTRGHLVGKRGVAASPLRPGGSVEIDGRRYEAAAESGFIDAGVPVEVVSPASFGLNVRPAGET